MITPYQLIRELELKKNQWEPIPKSELKNFDDEILDLIQTAYAPIGGHPNYSSTSDVHSQGADYEVIDLDDDPGPDAVSVTKDRANNKKFTATGHDNSKPAKSAVIKHKVDKLKDRGYYIEVSGRIKDILLGKGVSPIDDEEMVRKLLPGKEIVWNGDGTYERNLAGKTYTKMMLGKPKLEENKKPHKMKKSEFKKLIKEEIKKSLVSEEIYDLQRDLQSILGSGYTQQDAEEYLDRELSDYEASELFGSKSRGGRYQSRDDRQRWLYNKIREEKDEEIVDKYEGIYKDDLMKEISLEISGIEEGESLSLKVKNIGGGQFDINWGFNEAKDWGTGEFSDDNPIVKGITKGVKAVGKGLNKFAKKMEPLGKGAAGAMRMEEGSMTDEDEEYLEIITNKLRDREKVDIIDTLVAIIATYDFKTIKKIAQNL